VLGHRAAAGDLLVVDLARAGAGLGRTACLLDGPREVDGGRPRRAKDRGRLVGTLAPLDRERIPVRRRYPDRRRTADCERPDRVGDLGRRAALEVGLLVWESALVEYYDAVALEPNDLALS
jgi:hypothetical protein